MKITIEVLKDGSVKVGGDAAPDGPFHNRLANVAAIGVLELAKASLLVRRWGIDLSNGGKPFEQEQDKPFEQEEGE